ncbi:MAG: Uma2 family endonuclease [Candidatus Viridilinea halotolerans]|uniref:Uma2 family endonuclease n=1 Tax=Candidatus Viridilinea halotolerans TaxID=2491704 RepID=A0A426UA17_9CHLR|nr:MAG: Uma2 family endonuclease [Candidatus Viridilinea halotolerans]
MGHGPKGKFMNNPYQPSAEELEQLLRSGAIKLERTAGISTWEMLPSSRHQMIIDQIRATLKPNGAAPHPCGCHHLADVAIRFPDGSLKRPDIAIFCAPPPMQDSALTLLPVAVIEVLSLGYEYKDVTLNPPFYLGHQIMDVVVVDPHAQRVTHYTPTGTQTQPTPTSLQLRCGCFCQVP